MRGIKKIIFLIITSFMFMGLTGCSEKVITKEEAKAKLEYDSKLLDALTKSSDSFPNNAEKIFNDAIKELEEDINSIFKGSKESANLKLRDEIKKELKSIEVAYEKIIEDSGDIQLYMDFLELEIINDKERLAIKNVYESSKMDMEKVLIQYILSTEKGEKGPTVLNGLTMQCEKVMNDYIYLNKLYNLSGNKDYLNLYEEKIPEFKNKIDQRFSLDNEEIKFLEVKTQKDKEAIFEKAKVEIEKNVSIGKLSFSTNVMSDDVVIKKSGSIYVIKSYVDVASNGSTERRELTIKLDINEDYTMFISLEI